MRFIVLFFLLLNFNGIQAQNEIKNSAAQVFQDKLNREFKDPALSPLTPKERKEFTALEFFKIDPDYRIIAEFVRTPFESPFEMPTTTDRKPVYVKYGELHFSLKGKEYVLNIYQNQHPKPGYEDYLFLPFTDLTNGETSYSGGRYIDMQIPFSNQVVLDFNTAYNPYCAYSGEYSCPLPPKENHLDLRIPAGVKTYKKKG